MARRWQLHGPMIGVSTACSAATHAIGEAFRNIQEGDAKLMVAGGYDALTTWLDVLGYTLLGALTSAGVADVETAARRILATGCQAVRVKGGHGPGAVCRDCLVTADGRVTWYESPRIKTRNTHGTGCVLSAAIATGLAQGKSVEAAIVRARRFLLRSLVAGRKFSLGQGQGPAFAGIVRRPG